MRIPLDYYRILGLPNQATAEQLKQAHRDRTLQLPRREFSEAAIVTRKQLLDEAFSILSNPEQRQDYDEHFLASTYDSDPDLEDAGDDESQSPTIEIDDPQLVGALLILQELGEYELVLRLGRPFLSSGTADLKSGRFGDPKIVLSDIVLTVALSCLELGREQWHQGQYENAAEALETGQELLLREGLFISLRGEIQADLYKLRPYRILELLALPDDNAQARQHGITLLKDMLRERGGIDGSGNDQSGLSVDDFLRFIQQLRSYLSAEEQQLLFEEEARRPSAVATYLAVYALLARGFAQQQPALIRRAKAMLARLGTRQDVHLEQAVCALLLGQTEEASRVLELSQEYEPLAFIREQSQGSPDLLPGLCLYSERWLQDEVFPHFRDLAKAQSSLKEYFANEQVQAYLEELPAEADQRDWALTQSWHRRIHSDVEAPANLTTARNGQVVSAATVEAYRDRVTPVTTTNPTGEDPFASAAVATLPPAERLVSDRTGGSRSTPRRRGSGQGNDRAPRMPVGGAQSAIADPHTFEARGSDKPERKSRLPLILAGIAAAGLLGFGLIKSVKSFMGNGGREVAASTVPLLVELDKPVVQLGSPQAPVAVSGDMTQAAAQALLEGWFSAKKEAMGPSHNSDRLSQVLAEPRLSEWQRSADDAKQSKLSIQYDHSVKVESVEVNPSDPNQATIAASVTEIRKYSENGQIADTQTDRDMQLRYSLVKQDKQWRIKDWK